jgi:hypothetical protein
MRLGLSPGASPDTLKPAWRRAVSTLHPDRNGPQADRELAEVNAAFQRLQAFAQRHGRLPSPLDTPHRTVPPVRRGPGRWAMTAFVVAAALVVLWPQSRPAERAPAEDDVAEPSNDIPAPLPRLTAIGTPTPQLRLGLDASEAERIAGPPLFRSAERWEYGPSEIRFTDGKVSGWHSSPLRPLPVDDMPRSPAAVRD